MPSPYAGTWMASLPRISSQAKFIISSTDCTVQCQPVGAEPKNFMSGIWALDDQANFLILLQPPPHWPNTYSIAWRGSFQSTNSGTCGYLTYDAGRNLTSLEPGTITRVSS